MYMHNHKCKYTAFNPVEKRNQKLKAIPKQKGTTIVDTDSKSKLSND